MTKLDVLYQVVIRLSKPPFLEDLVNVILSKQSLDSLRLESNPYARLELMKVLTANSYEALDRELESILNQEIREVESQLPGPYRGVAESLRELFSLEDVPSRIEAGELNPGKYAVCRGRDISCYINIYTSSLLEAMSKTSEDPWSALSIIAALLYGVYTRHVEGLKVLGLKPTYAGELGILLSLVKGPGSVYLASTVEKIAQLSSLWARDPVEYFASEARIVYEASKTSLYFKGGLLNILTHFFITRYYESKLLRIIASKRIEHVVHP